MQIFTSEQTACCFVESYPWLPDMLAIACWTAYMAGEADALVLLAPQGTHSMPGALPQTPPLSPLSTEG